MSYTPPHSHNRHSSLGTVYEDNDPYRIVKKSPRIGKNKKKKKLLRDLPINLEKNLRVHFR